MNRSIALVPTPVETPAARAARLQAEAGSIALEAYGDYLATLERSVLQGRELLALTTLPAGVRDIARRLADEVESRTLDMTSIRARVG
ncbi:MAG: hypothetical protein KA105_02565 [Caulobacter sp.]|nr:hypothetical protein [Caulobacter sp.]